MTSSSKRIKLHRMALNEVVKLNLVPRRRQASESAATFTPVARKRVTGEGSVQNSKEVVQRLLPEPDMSPKVMSHAMRRPESSAATQRRTREAGLQSCGELKEEEPRTRDDIISHLNPSGLAGSEVSLRRACQCRVSGDRKPVSLQQRKHGKRGRLNISPGPAPSSATVKLRTKNKLTKTSKKIVLWINRYTEVTLCDVARYCNPCTHNCGFLLPDTLETKVVRCFKRDMRASFRIFPRCVGHDTCKSEECTAAESSKFSPRDLPAGNISQSLHERQGNVREHLEVESGSRPSLCHFPKGWKSDATPTNNGEYHTTIWNRDLKEQNQGDKMHIGKRTRNNKKTKTGSINKEEKCHWMSEHIQPCLEPSRGNGSGSAVRENGFQKKPEPLGPIGSEVVCEVEKDDPESFSCQRARAYFRKIKLVSCARTYMPWPFSNKGCTLVANASSTACPAGGSPSYESSSKTKAPAAPSESPNQAQLSKVREEINEQKLLNDRTWNMHGLTVLCSPDTTNAEKPPQCPLLGTSTLSNQSHVESNPYTATFSKSPTTFIESCSSISTLALSDWEVSSPFTHASLSHLPTQSSFQLKRDTSVEFADAHSTSASPSSPQSLENLKLFCRSDYELGNSALLQYSDSSQSCESYLLLPQESDEIPFPNSVPQKLEPHYVKTSDCHEYNVSTERCVEVLLDEFMILPLLSPLSSPQLYSHGSISPRLETEEVNKDPGKHKLLPKHHLPEINGSHQSNAEDGEYYNEEMDEKVSECRTTSTPSSFKDITDNKEDKSQDEADYDHDGEQGDSSSERDPLDSEVKATLTSEPHCSPIIMENDGKDFSNKRQSPRATEVTELSLSQIEGHKGDPKVAAEDGQPGVLDEFSAYEQDILLVDVTPDDLELFENIPEQSLLKLGPVRVSEAGNSRAAGVMNKLASQVEGGSLEFGRNLSSVSVNYLWNRNDITEEEDRPWRPQSSKMQNTRIVAFKETRNMAQPDANNNCVRRVVDRCQPVQTINSSSNSTPFTAVRNGSRITNVATLAEFRRQKSNGYCRQYFSESLSCFYKACRFQHVPVDGDEKFCVETLSRFTKNSMCLHKAGAIFTGYYQNNSPGVYFSMPVFLTLLWALLKAGMVADVFSVLSVSLTHKIVPSYDFLLALFNSVRERDLMGLVPELKQLLLKMANAGVVLSLDCFDSVKITPEFQHTVHPASPPSVEPLPEYWNLAYSLVEIELCAKQEDWRRMGEVFTFLCQFNQHPNQLERISGRVLIALLTESKDKLSVPFVTFAETVYQREDGDGLNKSFLGRIGVSLMLRYHKTQQWAKGQKVVEVFSMYKVNYSTLKGLFGNEDRASRCCLITVAAELFLQGGSVEGALNTLRENEWFLSSCPWPCEPADLESRSSVLIRLAGKTSQRDTLEVLCNLPGIKEPSDMIDASRYSHLFNAHLQVCVDRQILPVASDTVDFMLSKNLPVDHNVLQIILHKLGKQNLWLRAREVFRHSLSAGYYQDISAPTGLMSLTVPCHLGEVELALSFEMFIAVNATGINLSDSSSSSLSITLKRTQHCESEYLSAGSRLLSAACVPQPKLTVHYTAVNASQEQVFTLNISSAQRWLRCNHLWANEVWMQ